MALSLFGAGFRECGFHHHHEVFSADFENVTLQLSKCCCELLKGSNEGLGIASAPRAS